MAGVLLSYAFRPFFLLNSFFAVAVMLLWILVLSGAGPPSAALAVSPLWHGHEMLFGFAGAAIAGFVLTAVATWTGRPPVSGHWLGALVLSWLAGRLVVIFAGILPGWLVTGVDLAFPVFLCVLVSREVLAAGNRRNYPVAVIMGLIALLNLLYHLGTHQVIPGGARLGLQLMVHLVLLLITVIGGRIIPNFTTNWLKARGKGRLPRQIPTVERLVIPLTAATGLAISLELMAPVVATLALATGLVHGRRLNQWCGMATMDEPLLFILHAAYLWLPIGYLLTALAVMGLVLPPAAALHALTMGGIGGMILAVTTRVALAHTGRALHARPLIVVAYAVLALSAALRVIAPMAGSNFLAVMNLSAAGWIFSFGCFAWVYWPILTRPRVDGRPG